MAADCARLMARVDARRMARDLSYLCADPLPFRTLNYRLPHHDRSTLEEADDYLTAQLGAAGYVVEREGVPVQAFRRDVTRPITRQYAPPDPADPTYTAYNLYARLPGADLPEQTIVIMAHKDSQSWLPSPGANDNAVGTVGLLELARALAGWQPRHTVTCLFCNEEHTPWTSVTAAQRLAAEGRAVLAAINLDGIGAQGDAGRASGGWANVTRYTTPEGEQLADLAADLNARYSLGLAQSKAAVERPADDEGSFIRAGFPAAILHIGSWPYADEAYHQETDRASRVHLDNAAAVVRLTIAMVAYLDGA